MEGSPYQLMRKGKRPYDKLMTIGVDGSCLNLKKKDGSSEVSGKWGSEWLIERKWNKEIR